MLFKSALLTQASGSVGGITASHNAGGMYLRARTIPTDPNSNAQVAVRTAMSFLAARWTDDLSTVQRNAWAAYAANVAMTNPLGDAINLSGQMHYLRSNVIRKRLGFPVIDAAPVVFNLGEFTAMSFVGSEATQELTITFTDADHWPQTDDAWAVFHQSLPQNPSINFFKGPFQLHGYFEGDTAVPIVTPLILGTRVPVVQGQKLFMRVRVLFEDGRLPTAQIMTATIGA